jgi:hypothetical protein
LEKTYVSSHYPIPPFFDNVGKDPSCVDNISTYFSIDVIKRGFSGDNETLRVTLMVMSSSHCPILSFPSLHIEEEAMEKDK